MAKNKCAVSLGRKGGKAAVKKKAGIHSAAYKKKVASKKNKSKSVQKSLFDRRPR